MRVRKPAVPQAVNVLAGPPGGDRVLYRFGVSRDRATPQGETAVAAGAPLPAGDVARDWRLLMRHRLDVAWLPPEGVFLKALRLPACAPGELAGMIEFQIEKISPMPPAQVVWNVESFPHPDPASQTAVVTVVARAAVETLLAGLEGGGYTADRLEHPALRALLATPAGGDSIDVAVVAAPGGPVAIVAWRVGGALQDLSQSRLSAEDPAGALVASLDRAAWAAELDGWLAEVPAVRLSAEPGLAEVFRGPLAEWSGLPVQVSTPRAEAELAALTAAHVLLPAEASPVPEEVRVRQRARYVDTLWVKGLGGLGLAYLVVVFIYLAALTVQKSRLDSLRDETRAMALQYTNTLQLRARMNVLQEQVSLRFAALDCWNAVIEKLPETLTLSQLNFRGGRTLALDGVTTEDGRGDITRFNSELRTATASGRPLFSEVRPATTTQRGGQLQWKFEADLQREEGVP
jgi:hypothetical protein